MRFNPLKMLLNILFVAMLSLPCQAISSERIKISIDAEHQPLVKVLESLSRQSGYRITISREVHNVPVSVKIRHTNIRAALKEVIRNLSNINYFEIRNERNKSVDILVIGSFSNGFAGSDLNPNRTIENSSHNEDTISRVRVSQIIQKYEEEKTEEFMLTEILPAEHGGEAVTLADVYEAKSRHQAEMENGSGSGYIFPPDGSDERGLTEAEIDAIQQNYKRAKQAQNDNDIIMLPGEQIDDAITAGEVKAIKEAYRNEKNKRTGSTKIMLPGDTEETAITVDQINALKKSYRESQTSTHKEDAP